jgi:hypothetical protein
MAMKIIGSSPRRGEPLESRAGSRPIGGAREFAVFALLALCLAVIVAIFFGRGRGAVKVGESQPTAAANRAAAPNRNSQPNAAVASAHGQTSQDQASDDYTAWAATAAGNFGTAADKAENLVLEIAVDLVWDPVFGLSNRIVGYVADSWVNPVTGDRIIFNAAPGASHMAVSILAFAMVGVVMLALTGPLYASWKSWRLSRANSFRGRPH